MRKTCKIRALEGPALGNREGVLLPRGRVGAERKLLLALLPTQTAVSAETQRPKTLISHKVLKDGLRFFITTSNL